MNVFDYLFESKENSDKEFVIGSEERITFRDLYSQSLKLSSYLDNNIANSEKILIIAPNSIFFIIAYLGILKSKHVCVPLNYEFKSETITEILRITEATTIFLLKKYEKELHIDSDIKVINEDKLKDLLTNYQTKDSKYVSEENELAEIIFTSGSTGEPKGVMLSHKNIIANTSSILSYLNLTSKDIVLVVMPFYYCYGLSLLHTHLKVKGSIVLNNNFVFLGTVISDLKRFKCTGFSGVPSHFQILLKKSKTFKNTEFPELRYVTQAGGKLHDVFIEEFVSAFPEKKFFVMYGQTEATARLSFLPPELVHVKMGSIGKGIPGVELKIVDEFNNPVDLDSEGELIARGDNVMIGYYKDDFGTSQVLHDGWLHTGDIAYMDKDGFIYLVARKKEIFKVAGKRISPKEIEKVILSVPGVIDCEVKSFSDEMWGEGIEAEIFINLGTDQKTINERIMHECKLRLEPFKRPQQLKFIRNRAFKNSGKK